MILIVSAKCSDCCYTRLVDDDGNILREQDGYVPHDLNIGGGDYVEFELDLETGEIVGFNPVSKEKALQAFDE